MRSSRTGREDRNRGHELNKKEMASSFGSCQKTQTRTSPPREGEPAAPTAKQLTPTIITTTTTTTTTSKARKWPDSTVEV